MFRACMQALSAGSVRDLIYRHRYADEGVQEDEEDVTLEHGAGREHAGYGRGEGLERVLACDMFST